MKNYKENRSMTVSYIGTQKGDSVPMIRMQGKWLESLGFNTGDKLNVACQDGRIIITHQDEIVVN